MPSVLDAFKPPQLPLSAPTAPQVFSSRTPVGSRAFGDSAAVRRSIYDEARTAAQGFEPVSNDLHTLQLVDVDYDDDDDEDDISIAKQKKALLEKRNLGRSLRGTWQLVDNVSGKVIDEKRSTVARVPYFSNRGTFIRKGNEYTLANQMRLRSGVYHRVKDNGELHSHVNVRQRTGQSHHIFLEPETGIFKAEVNKAKIPLISILRALGASDTQLQEAWGDLAAVNMQKASPADLKKVYQKFVRYGTATEDASRREAINQAFAKMELDPATTERTLGKPFKNVNVESILASTRKLLAIRNKDNPEVLAKLGLEPADVDDRDSLAFMRFLGPEDLIAERLSKSKGLMSKALWKATANKSVQNISTGLMSKDLDVGGGGWALAQPLEGINPAQIFEQQIRVSKMGEGGIGSSLGIPAESRNVQGSHFGFIDPIVTPESERVGVDLRFAGNVRKGKNGRIYTHIRDANSGKMVWRDPEDIASAIVAFPGELRSNKSHVAAMVNGKVKYVLRKEVDYEVPHMEEAFSFLANMVPLKSAMMPQRAVMSSRMLSQALPLDNAEAPFVQSGVPGEDFSFEDKYGSKMGAIRAKSGGTVMKVTGDEVTVKYNNGDVETIEMYNNYPYNRKTYIHQDAVVEKGQRFSKGALLAKSNFVDDSGTTALGLNVRVAYIPFRGQNFEDAVVVSESFAKRLSSQHMYKNTIDFSEEQARTSKVGFTAMFPGKFDRDILENMDDDGVVKPGAVINSGDPLALVIRKRERTAHEVSRGSATRFIDKTRIWSHHAPGVVADVVKTKQGTIITVKSTATAKIGDKISGRYGDKGVISAIIPDDEMPVYGDQPAELLLNPLGIISRTNPAQMIEAALGKIAKKTGKPYKIQDFENIHDLTEFAMRELEEHGMQDLETVTDPTTGRQIADVFTGNRFFMKLHHIAESKGSARNFGGYTSEGRPSKGGEDSAKSIGVLQLSALLSHGATETIRDAKMIRGQMNPEYWSAFQAGFKPKAPKVPMVYTKFVNQLKAAGINPVREGTRMHLMAMTEKDITKLAGNREITEARTVDWKKGLTPLKNGLFDPELTGGHGGDQWSFIKLPEPMPNPVMQEPVMRVLGLTQPKFREVISGKAELGGLTGPRAIAHALDKINLPLAIGQARQDVKSSKGEQRNAAVKRLRYLKGAQTQKIHPRDWILSRVPVLPPAFRPVSIMQGTSQPMVADTNYLYRDLLNASKNLKENAQRSDDIGDERIAVYDAFRSVTGLGDPVSGDAKDRKVRGVLSEIFGKNPKYSVVQRKLLSFTTDVSGRAAITPNPDLDMDQVGLPEENAWEVYQPLIIKYLGKRGFSKLDAARAVKDRTDAARKGMLKIMGERPVIINRSPVLHRYGVMAFWPQLVKNDTMQVSPLIVGGFNADFDGDAMQYHVPISESAVDEAINKLLPSRNLFSAQNFGVHYKPSQEYIGGLYNASTAKKRGGAKTFASKAEAIKAYRRGEISAGQQVVILNS